LTIAPQGASLALVLEPVPRQSLSEAVFAQLRDRIVAGALAPGSPLPPERVLCAELGVARGAVREALRRLEQARLISVRHGGTSTVLDFRTSAGMDLLVDLIGTGAGDVEPRVVRGIVEMRSALAPDVARLAALRRPPGAPARLRALVERMAREKEEGGAAALPGLQELSQAFWSELVAASDNLAYQLAFNTLREVYGRSWDLLRPLLAEELSDVKGYRALARAVERSQPAAAARSARGLVRMGERRIAAALDRLEARAAGRRSA
jgi:DNA-binding FadR family transcriptional regulator